MQIPPSALHSGAKAVCVAPIRLFTGHKAAVQSLAGSPQGVEICSGAWDGSILLWSTAAEAEEEDPGAVKKQRVGVNEAAPPAVPQVAPRAQLEGHTGCVSALSWQSTTELWSGSWDHSLRCWDVATRVNVQTLVPPCTLHPRQDGRMGGWKDGRGEGGLIPDWQQSGSLH